VAGMVSGGPDKPDSVKFAWPRKRAPAVTCPWSSADKLPGLIVRETQEQQCFYADLLRTESHTSLAPATVFLSHVRYIRIPPCVWIPSALPCCSLSSK